MNGAMAKDTEQVDESHKSDAPRMSVREAIISAREEVEAKQDEKEEVEVKDKPSQDKPKGKTLSKSDNDISDIEEISDKEDDQEDNTTEELKEEKPKIDTKPPPGWSKEAKTEWANLSENVRASIAKREKEVSDGFAGTKQTQDRLKEFDTVVAPYVPAIQQMGVTPAQTVGKLLEWFSLISHANKEVRTSAFKALAQNYQVDLGNQTPSQDNSQQTNTTELADTDNNPPAWAQSLIAQQQEIQRNIATQRQQSTEDFVNSWALAKDTSGNLLRPHYGNEEIRKSIAGLIQTGVVPLENGQITHGVLDKAYQKAIRTNDDIWAEIQQQQDEAKEASKKVEADKRAATARAAKAKAVSLKPGAPTGQSSGANGQSKPNGQVRARDSIMSAIKELNG